jgi:hypothetical protein
MQLFAQLMDAPFSFRTGACLSRSGLKRLTSGISILIPQKRRSKEGPGS